MSKELKIIFLGTPDFAAASLQALLDAGKQVVAVITAPDRPKGRGKKLGTSAVKDCALAANIPVLQPTNLKNEAFLDELKAFNADLQIVVAFRMLPVAVWDMPRLGTFNLHASLLPQYRGAAPINWAIINGETETGITTFFLKHEIDTGEIIFQETEPIHADDDFGTLYYRLMNKGAKLVVKTTESIEVGNYPQEPQTQQGPLKSAPKIFKQDCEINWDDTMENIRNFVRGLSPYPAAWTLFQGKNFKIFEVMISNAGTNKPTGVCYSDNKTYLRVNCKDGTLAVTDLQMEGKKRMATDEFLRGYDF